jgi:hypothetical protein
MAPEFCLTLPHFHLRKWGRLGRVNFFVTGQHLVSRDHCFIQRRAACFTVQIVAIPSPMVLDHSS